MARREREGQMSFSVSFHQALLSPTGAHWLDDPSDLTCKENTPQHAVDDPLLSCKQQQVGVRVPARLPNLQVKRSLEGAEAGRSARVVLPVVAPCSPCSPAGSARPPSGRQCLSAVT